MYGSRFREGEAHRFAGRNDRRLEIYRTMAAQPGPDQVVGLGMLLYVLPEVGRGDEARAIADEVMLAARTSGNPIMIAYTLHGYGRAFAETDPERGLGAMRRALAAAREQGIGFFEALFARDLASVEAACGDRDEACRLFDIAIETFYRAGNGGSLALTLGYLTMFLDDIDRPSVAATIYGASTRYAAISTLTKLPTTVEHLRLVLGETECTRCVASGADMEPADAVRYARQQIEMLSRQPNAASEPASR
jgi:hypothetical protein